MTLNEFIKKEKEILQVLEKCNKKLAYFSGKTDDYKLQTLTAFALDLRDEIIEKIDDDKLKKLNKIDEDSYEFLLLSKMVREYLIILDSTYILIKDNAIETKSQLEKHQRIKEELQGILKRLKISQDKNYFSNDAITEVAIKENELITMKKRKIIAVEYSGDISEIEFKFNTGICKDFSGVFIDFDSFLILENLSEVKKADEEFIELKAGETNE